MSPFGKAARSMPFFAATVSKGIMSAGGIFQASFGCAEKFVIIYALYIIGKHQKMRHQGKHFFTFYILKLLRLYPRQCLPFFQLLHDHEETAEARIVCVRNRQNRKEWIAILSTDMSLSEEEIIRLYGSAGTSRGSSRPVRATCICAVITDCPTMHLPHILRRALST